AQGLRAGVVENGRVTLSGPLTQFPFHGDEATGDFALRAPYRDARVDYQPAANGEPGWPALHDMHGQVDIHGASIRIQAETASMTPAPSGDIALEKIQADIPNMRHQPTLQVRGETRAEAGIYLDLIRNTPLSAMLDHTFDASRAEGQWSIPLELTIPLHAGDTD